MSGSLGLSQNKQDSKAQSTSSSTSESYGYSGSESGDTSRSISEGFGGGSSSSNQAIAFEDLYKQLYGGATNAANNVAMQAPQLQQAAQQLFTGGSQFLQSLNGNAGSNYMTERLSGPSPVEDIIASMKTDAGNLFREELNPAITSRAVASGALGGGRQGVAQGIAQGKVADDFTRNAAALRYSDVQAKDAIAANVAGNSIAAANTGLGSLPGMLDLVERGQNAELAPYGSLSSILGGPTTLTSAESSDFSRTTAQSAADAFSRSFGEQSAESQSQSQSTAKSKGRAWSFDSSFSYLGGS
jgi:hypothetical protein